MRLIKEHSSFCIAVILFIAVLTIVYPYYQYYIDPDATAYLTIATRYATGDFQKAVNGYWSPWSIWLTALLIKAGTEAFKAAIIVNATGAVCFLSISHSLFIFFRLQSAVRWMLHLALSFFLVYAVFWQTFDDLWECFFLLVVLRIILKENFASDFRLWIMAGFWGALAYFAKAYAFPFFILQIIVCTYFITNAGLKANRGRWMKIVFVSVGTLLVCSFPWMYLLHEKYGVWMTGTAGKLNTSWYLIGHPYWKEGIQHLLPPVYADSPSYWEDAYVVNGATPHFWDSPKLFFLQIVRIGYNILKFVQSINELSCFFALAIIISIVILFSNKMRARTHKKFIVLCASFLLFPLGYFLINFQGRYLWYLLPLCMIIIAVTMHRTSLYHNISRQLRVAILIIFAFSFVAFPILGLKQMYKVGYREHQIAGILRTENISGSFTTNIPYSPKTQSIMRIAYFSGNPYYQLPKPVSKSALLAEMRRYDIKYYFHFYDGDWDNFQFTDENDRPFLEIIPGKIKGIKVFTTASEAQNHVPN